MNCCCNQKDFFLSWLILNELLHLVQVNFIKYNYKSVSIISRYGVTYNKFSLLLSDAAQGLIPWDVHKELNLKCIFGFSLWNFS